jgi:hypothetical protein
MLEKRRLICQKLDDKNVKITTENGENVQISNSQNVGSPDVLNLTD